MKPIIHFITQLLIGAAMTLGAQQEFNVKSFKEIIISPHIEATLIESDTEKVVVNSSAEPIEKVNVEVKGKTLRVYLDDAKDITKTEKVKKNNYKYKKPIYQGTVLNITVYYKNLDLLSIRGEEKIVCESSIDQEIFKLKIYGEPDVNFNELNLEEFKVTVYGDSELKVEKGRVHEQRVVVYGEAEVNLLGIDNGSSRLTAYGEAEFKINAKKRIKFTTYGESTLGYKGNPDIDKGISIGEYEIYQIQ